MGPFETFWIQNSLGDSIDRTFRLKLFIVYPSTYWHVHYFRWLTLWDLLSLRNRYLVLAVNFCLTHSQRDSFQWKFRGRENQSGAIWSRIEESRVLVASFYTLRFSNFTNKWLHTQKLWGSFYFVFYALSDAQLFNYFQSSPFFSLNARVCHANSKSGTLFALDSADILNEIKYII